MCGFPTAGGSHECFKAAGNITVHQGDIYSSPHIVPDAAHQSKRSKRRRLENGRFWRAARRQGTFTVDLAWKQFLENVDKRL